MDRERIIERLDPATDDPDELFEHFERRYVGGNAHYVLTDARHGLERGTVVVEDEGIVRGYPSIPRVLVAETGIPEFFEPDDSVVVEEKLNGFNVRVAAPGELLAFTRSGYVCPYTTARVGDLLDLDQFFTDHPGKMLCAELIGPETPYTDHDYEGISSDAVRVFDIRDRESGDPLPVADRDDLCDRYDLPQPRQFGRSDPDRAVETVRDAIQDLDDAGREGVVMKSADGTALVKYTTEAQHHADLAHAFSVPFEYGRDFLFSRVIRDGFQAVEFEEAPDRVRERAHDLGESILFPFVEAIRRVERGDPVGEIHTVRAEPAVVEQLLAHLRDQGLTMEILHDQHEDGQRVVEFVKVAQSTRDQIDHYLSGGTRDE
ncbi:RNA ligase [Halobacteriaceae archaeon SHR40]|uniref:RNA ligase n=1 Tax=Halovenus amylolytica TaxID=2500550 RepID=UPI000FE424F3